MSQMGHERPCPSFTPGEECLATREGSAESRQTAIVLAPRPRPMIRTETSTIVFTDLVGSTQLLVRLGHDAYEALRRSHFDSLRLAASVHQGTEINSSGDGLVFAFRNAGDGHAPVGCGRGDSGRHRCGRLVGQTGKLHRQVELAPQDVCAG
jgi:class 3 adenylate cyclase